MVEVERQGAERQQVPKNVEQNPVVAGANGMSWDDWVEWAERRELSRKQTLMGATQRYRDMYLDMED